LRIPDKYVTLDISRFEEDRQSRAKGPRKVRTPQSGMLANGQWG
jgi:hypothetical protein